MITTLSMMAGYLALSLFLAGIVCIAFAERTGPVQDDEYTPELPFPGPVAPDYKVPADYILEARRAAWRAVDKAKKTGAI